MIYARRMGYNLLTGHQIFATKMRGATAPPEQARRQERRQNNAERNTPNGLNNQAHGAERKRAPRAQLNKIFRFYIAFIEL